MTITNATPRGFRGPSRSTERVPAPDLARGFMLLFIALANSAAFAFGTQPGVGAHSEGIERGLDLFMFTLVNSHAYPMFAVMFGYGLVQLSRRQEKAGATPAAVRSVLLRRNGWLLAFGALHGVLLSFGDFLGAYGLAGIIIAALLLRRGAWVNWVVLALWGATTLYVLVLGGSVALGMTHGSGAGAGVPTSQVDSLGAPDYGTAVLDRLREWPSHTATVVPFVFVVWLGVWAARRRVLEDPANHRRLLYTVAAAGLGVGIAGGLPLALVSAGFLDADASTVETMSRLHAACGMFAGPGYVAVFGLLGLGLLRSRAALAHPLTASLSALGRRSLSGYLIQSVAWVLLFSPYTLSLGHSSGSPRVVAAVLALLVWLGTLLGAFLLEHRSLPGPAEAVLRRLTYGRRG